MANNALKRKLATEIVQRLRAQKYDAYFVGGCVRDLLRKKTPKDYDIATNATPTEIQKLFKKTIPVGAKFGVMIVLSGGESFEVATFRTDFGYVDGRHPTAVKFTDAKEDAARRDFTVNALFYDPIKGQALDWVGGEKDLKSKVIRAVGDPSKRFEEDKLRLLRAVRFANVLDFSIEPKTFAAIRKYAPKITEVSAERVRDELIKMLTGPDPAKAIKLLDKTGLLSYVLPEVSALKGVSQPKKFHPEGDVYRHTLLMMETLKTPSLLLSLACLFHDIGKPRTYRRARRIQFRSHEQVGARMTDEILRRLRFPNEIVRDVVACVEGHMRFKDARKMRESTLKRFLRRPTFQTELELHKIDCEASHGDIRNWSYLTKKLKDYGREAIRPKPLVNGHDLLKLGFTEGPLIGKILTEIESKQLENQLTTKKDALSWASKKYSKKNPPRPATKK